MLQTDPADRVAPADFFDRWGLPALARDTRSAAASAAAVRSEANLRAFAARIRAAAPAAGNPARSVL